MSKANKNSELTGVLFDPRTDTRTVLQYNAKDALHEWYRLIGCSMVEVTYIPVTSEREVCVMLDEEGWLKPLDAGATMVKTPAGYLNIFAGPILFVGHADDEGETLSLSQDEINDIMNLIAYRFVPKAIAEKMNPLN